MIDYKNDFNIDYFGFKTLMKSYLTKVGEETVENPSDLFLRVAVSIHDNLEQIQETYHYLANGYFTHATPILFHAGTRNL